MANGNTMNMMATNIKRFTNEIKTDLEDGNYEPMVGLGKSGVGKTMCISELCAKLGIGYCELRLVTLTEIDMLGIPKENADGRTTYAANALLPDAKLNGEKGILVLDEITSASPTVRAAAFQLLDSKRALGEYKLPEHWKVIALGNGIEDGGVFNGLEAAFISRCTCYRIEPDSNIWIEWAVRNNVNPAIVAFIKWQPDYMHKFNPDEMAGVFPCPRSWTSLSKRLTARENRLSESDKKKGLDITDVEFYAAGSIGVEMASLFSAFYAYKGDTLQPEDILSGKADPKAVASMQVEVIHLTIQSVVKQLADELDADGQGLQDFSDKMIQRTINVLKWGINSGRLDFAMILINTLTKATDKFCEMIVFCDKFGEMYPEFDDFVSEQNIVFGN